MFCSKGKQVPQEKIFLRDCPEILKKHGIKIGPNQLYKLLRLTNVIDDENYVLEPFDKTGYFDFVVIPHDKRYGRTGHHSKVYVTSSGLDFLIKHVKENLHLLKVTKEI
jgi:hypothetical protein